MVDVRDEMVDVKAIRRSLLTRRLILSPLRPSIRRIEEDASSKIFFNFPPWRLQRSSKNSPLLIESYIFVEAEVSLLELYQIVKLKKNSKCVHNIMLW